MMYRTERLEASIDIASYIDGYVDVERFLACCRECPNYGQLWSCPPYDFDPLDIWRAFDTLMVLAYRVTWSRAYTEGEMDMVHDRIKQKIADELYVMESHSPGSLSLSAGSCQLCEGCTRPCGQPCRYPDQLRYSIESLGGNVGNTLTDLCGVRLEWIEEGKLPTHMVLAGGLLKKEVIKGGN
jgi:predicted metal-binding protein